MTTHDTGFLRPAPASPAADRLFPDDREKFGYVMSLSRAWAHVPAAHHDLFDRLAGEAGGVLRGDAAWSPERALAAWARQLARHPNRTDAGDVVALPRAGYDNTQIVAITVFVGPADRLLDGRRRPGRAARRGAGRVRLRRRAGCREFRAAGRRVSDAVARPAGRRRVSRFTMIGFVETRGIEPLTPALQNRPRGGLAQWAVNENGT